MNAASVYPALPLSKNRNVMKSVVCLFGIFGTVSIGFCEPVDVILGFDQTANIEWITGERVEVEWNEVLDSRCPTGATCVWEGEATAVVDVVVNGVRTSDLEMTLHGQEFERAVVLAGGYRIQLVSVGPFPVLDRETQRPSYVARIIVSTLVGTGLGLGPLNTEWRLQVSGKLGEETPTLSESNVNLRFELLESGTGRITGKVTGSGGCNGFSGSVQASTVGAIQVGAIASTKKACATGVMDQEIRFFSELSKTIGFTMESDSRMRLMFQSTDDAVGTMIFTQAGDAGTAVSASSWGRVKARTNNR